MVATCSSRFRPIARFSVPIIPRGPTAPRYRILEYGNLSRIIARALRNSANCPNQRGKSSRSFFLRVEQRSFTIYVCREERRRKSKRGEIRFEAEWSDHDFARAIYNGTTTFLWLSIDNARLSRVSSRLSHDDPIGSSITLARRGRPIDLQRFRGISDASCRVNVEVNVDVPAFDEACR